MSNMTYYDYLKERDDQEMQEYLQRRRGENEKIMVAWETKWFPKITKPLIRKKGTIKRIHVDRHIIAANVKHGRSDPPITVQLSGGSYKTSSVDILGPSKIVYNPKKPLKCGAKLWIETRSDVEFK